MIRSLRLVDLRGYAALAVEFGPGPHLLHGPNAAGKTSLLEAVTLLAWGRSHRTTTDAEIVRWGAAFARVDGTVATGPEGRREEQVDVVIAAASSGGGGRKRIQVNGVPRRSSALAGLLRIVVFAPEEMLLIAGSPGLRRAALDQVALQRWPAYGAALTQYGRALAQRNSLLRAIRDRKSTRLNSSHT